MNLNSSVKNTIAQLRGNGRGWILLAISIGNLLSLGIRVAFPALLPDIRTEFQLTNTTAG